jgi:outer membrane protein TolC
MLRLLQCLVLLVLAVGLALAGGCQRPWYRRDADRETYATEAQHENEDLWPVARTVITAPPQSRLFDPFNPDYPPMPPDDPAANFFMRHPDGQPPPLTYHRDGDAPFIEDPQWRSYLQLDDKGNLVLSPEKAVALGLLNSRDYQTALETLYIAALNLTLERWNFTLHWHGINTTTFTQFGSSVTELNTLNSSTDIGFTRNLASGGQILLDFANTFVFTASGIDNYTWTSNIAFALMQPLLRNAGRRVALENLTQSERNVLYAVRDFAHFRKQFYVNLSTSGGAFGNSYLGLLFQVQNIRNQESNLKSNEQTLKLHEALFARGTLSTVEVDQAFQQYEGARLSLIQARTALETSLDSYKISLGLPPALPVKVDDAILKPFQLASPELEKLQGDVDVLFAKYRELDKAPSVESLKSGYQQLKDYFGQLDRLTTGVEGELKQWAEQPNPLTDDPSQAQREAATRAALERAMPEFRKELAKLGKDIDREQGSLTEGTRTKDWESLQKRSRQMIALAAQLYVVQTQVRVYLIQLSPIPYTAEEAAAYARENRLDLMNRRALVVDAWRKIDVTASALKTGLNLRVTGNIATKPTSQNPFDFRASASQYTVGLALDTPLDRMVERNEYRKSLILYQVARRNFMGLEDQVVQAVRQDVRQLELDRANFAIARQILIAAARQLEGARDKLLVLPNAADTTATQNVLTALTGVLNAKGSLISSWLNYQADRVQLLLDMDELQVDPRGLPINVDASSSSSNNPGAPEQLHAPRVQE